MTTIYRTDCAMVVAEFRNIKEAAICLPAMARSLKVNLRLVSDEVYTEPLPRYCHFDAPRRGIICRPL